MRDIDYTQPALPDLDSQLTEMAKAQLVRSQKRLSELAVLSFGSELVPTYGAKTRYRLDAEWHRNINTRQAYDTWLHAEGNGQEGVA